MWLASGAHTKRTPILGLTETNLTGSGTKDVHPLGDVAPTCTLYWSGHVEDKKKHSGVALLLAPEAKHALESFEPISDRLLKARFSTRHFSLSLFVAYAPHSSHTAEVQDSFWTRLSEELSAIPRRDMLMVIGDLNANTGQLREGIDSVLGPWTNPAERNKPGDFLIDMCSHHNMVITNTFFRHKAVHRDTYCGSQLTSKPKLLDYVLINRRFRSSVLDTRVFRDFSSYIDSDHELVASTICLKLRSQRRPRRCPKLDIEALSRDHTVLESYQDALHQCLDAAVEPVGASEPQDEDEAEVEAREVEVEELWRVLRDGILKAAGEALPSLEPKWRVPWFTEELFDMVEKKKVKFDKLRAAKLDTSLDGERKKELVVKLKAEYSKARNEVKTACRLARERQWSQEAKIYSEDVQARRFGSVFRRLRSFLRMKKGSACGQIRDEDGKLLTTTKEKLNRWMKYFRSLLYVDDPESACKENLAAAPPGRSPCNEPPDEPTPSLADIRGALRRMKNRKAAGPDGISPEFLKYGGPAVERKLHELIEAVWNSERAPQEWKDALIVTLYKKKNPTLCDNYRGLSLLSVPGKVYSLLLLDPLQERLEEVVMESQCGFRKGRSTTDQLFTLQQVFQDSWEYDVPTHTCFIDLRKAYDTVNRPALWGVLQHIGISAKLQRLIRDLHTGTRSSVRAYGDVSEHFDVNRGVRQGCILAPALFNIFLDHVLRIALDQSSGGVKVRYSIDGDVSVKTIERPNEVEELILSLLYADDMAIVCDDKDDLERTVVRLDEVLQRWCLDVSPEKTEVLTIDRHGRVGVPEIALRGHALENVDNFKYLGTYFTSLPLAKTAKQKKGKQQSAEQRPQKKVAVAAAAQNTEVPPDEEKVQSKPKQGKKRTSKTASADPRSKKTSFLVKNLEHRIAKANGAFYAYAAPLYRRKDIRLRHKIAIFKMTAIPTLLDGSEIWSPSADEVQRLESWQKRCLRYMLGIRYSTHGHVPYNEVLQRCKLPKIATRLRESRLRWFGHAARMSEDRLPRKMLTARLGTKRPVGRPRKSWRQVIKTDLEAIDCFETYPAEVQDRDSWRVKIKGPYRQTPTRPPRRSTRIAERR